MHARKRTLLLPLLLALVGCGADLDDAQGPEADTRAAASAQLAALAGASGPITTLGAYDDGSPHPGVNAIDIGAPGGAEVWHQIDYLPPGYQGGYLYVTQARDPGRCSQFSPGSPYYNGAKILVYTYFWVDGAWRVHQAAYQHVEPGAPLDTWLHWNNAASPLWPEGVAEVVLGDQTGSGLFVGTVFPVSRPITNGPGGGLCTTGSHLHQEGQGWRAPRRRLGEWVTARYNDLHFFVP